jgi:hypothetical protein
MGIRIQQSRTVPQIIVKSLAAVERARFFQLVNNVALILPSKLARIEGVTCVDMRKSCCKKLRTTGAFPPFLKVLLS